MNHKNTLAAVSAGFLIAAVSPALADSKDHIGMNPSAEQHMNVAAVGSQAQMHMRHVAESRKGIPGGRGYLPVALDEAKTAITHAAFTVQAPHKLDLIKNHTRHVIHAIDPRPDTNGPGLGYGVKKAAMGIVAHIGNAAASKDASANIKAHAPGVAAGAKNAVKWSDELIGHAQAVLKSSDAKSAMGHALEVQKIAKKIMAGDGNMPGLASSAAHLKAMQDGEKG